MEIKGKIHEVSPTVQVTDSLKKRELIVEYVENPQYPEYLKFEAIQDRCNLLDNVKVGEDIETLRFNTSIARITKLNNDITQAYPKGAVPRSLAEPLVLMIAPVAPPAG